MSERVVGQRIRVRVFLEGVEVEASSAVMSIPVDAPATCMIQIPYASRAIDLLPRTAVHVFTQIHDETSADAPSELFFSGEVFGVQRVKTPNETSIVLQCIDDSSYWDTAYQYYTDYGSAGSWLWDQKSSFLGTGVGLFDSIFREHASVIGGLLTTPSKTYPDLKGLVGGIVHLMEAVGGVLGRFQGFNDFFTYAEIRKRILAQISASEADDTSARVFQHKVFWQWLMRTLSSAGSVVTVRDMIKLIFQYVFHNIVPNPIAKFDPAPATTTTRNVVRTRFPPEKTKPTLAALQALQGEVVALQSALGGAFDQAYAQWASNYNTFATGLNGRLPHDKENKATFEAHDKAMAARLVQTAGEIESKLARWQNAWTYRIDPVSKSLPVAATRAAFHAAMSACRPILKENASLTTSTQASWRKAVALWGDPTPDLVKRRPMSADRRILLPATGADVGLRGKTTYGITLRDTIDNTPRIATHLHTMRTVLETLITSLGGVVRQVSTVLARDRLHNQIIRPDIWFLAPPKCNVLFPDDYNQVVFARNFFQEITRLELTTAMDLIPPNNITNSKYYAPNLQDVTGRHVLSSARGGVRLLMPHELYAGILPQFEFMMEGSVFAGLADQKKKVREHEQRLREHAKTLTEIVKGLRSTAAQSGDTIDQMRQRIERLDGQAENLRAGALSYAQRTANWLFFKKRFGTRALQTTGPFRGRIVNGFPTLIVDKASHPSSHETPSHFLGMSAQITHNLTHEGSSTSITYSEGREYRKGGDEFFAIQGGTLHSLAEAKTRKTVIRPRVLHTTITQEIATGSRLASTKNAHPGLTRKTEERLRDAERLAMWVTEYEANPANRGKVGAATSNATASSPRGPLRRQGGRGPHGGVIVRVTKSPATTTFASAIQGSLGVYFLPATPYAVEYTVVEHFTSKRSPILLPPEEQIFPAWLSPVYRNENIGKPQIGDRKGPYHQFFGCGAITDDTAETAEGRTTIKHVDEELLRNETGGTAQSQIRAGAVTPAKSIEEAINELAATYTSLLRRGLDAYSFVRHYTHRPVATLEEILGSENFEIDPDTGEILQGEAGFHSFASGPFSNLEGLRLTVPLTQAEKAKAALMDTRRQKWEAVMAYRDELDRGQARRG